MSYNKILVIGDAHDDPEQPKDRFTALGNLIAAEKPDTIVQIGDFANLDSVTSHDSRNLRLREGKRLIDDIMSLREAYARVMCPMVAANNSARQRRRKRYTPKMYWLEANHEYRVRSFINENPVLDGMIAETDLAEASKDGWEIVPYKRHAIIDNIVFTHIPIHPKNNQPLSGEYLAKRATDMYTSSVVFGHAHRLLVHPKAYYSFDNAPPNRIMGICVGWYGDYKPPYLSGVHASDWWSGLVFLHSYGNGNYDIETRTIQRVKRDYL